MDIVLSHSYSSSNKKAISILVFAVECAKIDGLTQHQLKLRNNRLNIGVHVKMTFVFANFIHVKYL